MTRSRASVLEPVRGNGPRLWAQHPQSHVGHHPLLAPVVAARRGHLGLGLEPLPPGGQGGDDRGAQEHTVGPKMDRLCRKPHLGAIGGSRRLGDAPQSDTAAGLWAVPAGISGPGELCLARAGRRLQAEMLGRALDPGAWAMASGSRSLTLALTCEKEVGFWWVGLGALGGDRFLCPVPHLHCSQEGGGRGSSRRRAQPWEPTLTLTGLCPAVAQSLSGGGAPSS